MPEITFTRVGDCFLPEIKLSDPPEAPPLGKYARMHRAYLREHRPVVYNELLLTERLYPLLREIDQTASERSARGVPEEIILAELVYA